MKILMIGHSTVLLELSGRKILTDPYFGSWGNPAYARSVPPCLGRESLCNVDIVLVSHNHWDHTDSRFFASLGSDIPVLAPKETAWMTRLKRAKNVIGLAKWEQREFGPLRITAVPAAHITVTRGFVIQAAGKTVYFAGDTYYRRFMKDIGTRFAPDLALLPVTTFRIPMTMGETSAMQAVRDLHPRTVIPIHLGISPRSPLLRTAQTAESFQNRVRDVGLDVRTKILHEGESWEE